MRRRWLESCAVATAVAAAMLLVQLNVPLSGQSKTAGGTGHPNFDGIWLDVYDTPFERSPALGDREFATAQERASRDQARSTNIGRNRRVERGSQQDVAGAYNAVFTSVKPAGPRTSLVVSPKNGRLPALTKEAEAALKVRRDWMLMLLRNTETCKNKSSACAGGEYGAVSPRRFDPTPFYNIDRMNRHDGPEDHSRFDRCVAGATPDFPGFRRIVQCGDQIAIGYDTGQGQAFQRIAYVGGTHPPKTVTFRHGDSRARWEGQTLVIETTNFSPKYPFAVGTFTSPEASPNRTLLEKYRLIDKDTLEYEVTMTDPATWTAPWTVKQEMKRQPDVENRIYYEPRCHEGNYGLTGLMIGARIAERDFKAGTGPDPFSLDTATDFTAESSGAAPQ